MRPAYADRPRLKARILDRLSKGARLYRIGEQPGLPSMATVYRWAKADENFRFNLAHALMEGAQVRRIARRSPAWHPGVADEFLARVRAGEWVGDLVRTYGMPHRAALDRWRRERPEFAQALSEAVRAARPRRRRRASIYSEEVADKVILALARGVPMRRLRRDAGLPCHLVLRSWRRQHPEFDGAVRIAIRRGHGLRLQTRRGSLAERREKILEALFCGATLRTLKDQPGLPHAPTVYAWMKRDPTFAAEVRWACEQRDFLQGPEAPTPRQLRRMREEG